MEESRWRGRPRNIREEEVMADPIKFDRMRMSRSLAILAYLLCIVGANWALERWGFVSVGFGLMAPAGVWFAGASFFCRDVVQETGGRRLVVAAIVFGAGLSWFVAPSFAVASGLAFLASETADFLVYTPLRRRHRYVAVALSNTVGSVVDSWLFLWLAFGSIAHWEGLVVGKLWTILPALVLLAIWRNRGHLDVRRRQARPGVA
jgi:queuosine precursor transporter